jgi:cation/acetate symporter
VWKDLLHNSEAIVPLKNPGVITVPLSFLVAILVSLATPEPDAQAGFDAAQRRMHLGPDA